MDPQSKVVILTHHTGEKASGMISPPAGCREELQIPRSRDDGGGGYKRFRGFLIGYSWFLHRGLLICEGGDRGGGQGHQTLARCEVGPTRAWGGSGPPGWPPGLSSGLL